MSTPMTDSGMGDNPLMQPRLVRMLKQRPRLIDLGFREEVLDQVDNRICKRRSPQHVADRVSDIIVNEASDATRPVMRNRVERRIDNMNNTVLQNL